MIYLAIFAVLTALDATLTYFIISRGGRELNPIMRWLMERFGLVTALVVFKGVVVAFLAGIELWWGGLPAWAWIAFIAAYVVLCIWNYKQLRG